MPTVPSPPQDQQKSPPYPSMSPLTSPYFHLQEIPHSGRGLIALQDLSPPLHIHTSPSPFAHVIFRPYRKEVCAQCFHYDRGRTLPHRDQTTGKVFCSAECTSTWTEDQGELGVEAWRALHTFTQKNAKSIVTTMDAPSPDASTTRPSESEIENAWTTSLNTPFSPRGKKSNLNPRTIISQGLDPDILTFYLSALLTSQSHPSLYKSSISSLTQDPRPYLSSADLQSHILSTAHLLPLLPSPLLSPTTIPIPSLCREIVSAASHNAFGIRAGSSPSDAEEYMGYAVYPSASYFNHSCAPNVAKKRVGRRWEFVVSEEVRVGEELCITYLGGDEKDMDVKARRTRLQQHWGFVCQCQRCRREAGES